MSRDYQVEATDCKGGVAQFITRTVKARRLVGYLGRMRDHAKSAPSQANNLKGGEKRKLKGKGVVFTLLAVVILGSPTLMTASAAGPGDPDTTVKVTDEWFWCGKTGTSQILVSIVNDPGDPRPLHGVEVHLRFDPTNLQVVDADGDPVNGIQIAAEDGLFPLDEQIVVQEIDNAEGTILFAVSRIGGDSVQDATDAAISTITWESAFECPNTTEPWEICSMVNVTEGTRMSDADGRPITVDNSIHGEVCDPAERTDTGIVGIIKLQGRYDHSGIMVSASLEDHGYYYAFTDAEGHFRIISDEFGTYTITARKPGYLPVHRTGVQYNSGQLPAMGTLTLLGGDVVPDEVIDIRDITYIASRFGGVDAFADVTGDGQVNILDLTVTVTNFGQSGLIP